MVIWLLDFTTERNKPENVILIYVGFGLNKKVKLKQSPKFLMVASWVIQFIITYNNVKDSECKNGCLIKLDRNLDH